MERHMLNIHPRDARDQVERQEGNGRCGKKSDGITVIIGVTLT